MSRAIVAHYSTDVREADLRWVLETARLPPDRIKLALPGFAQTTLGEFYSIHFWFYPLLATPLVALAGALGSDPIFAFAVINALSLFGAVMYTSARRSALEILATTAVMILCGGTFYLGWLGPEVLTASCVFIASLAATRGDVGVGMIAGGIAATQNPSAVALLPYVWLYWLRRRWLAPRDAPPLSWRWIPAGMLAASLAFLPYAFFRMKFGVLSLIAAQYIDTRLLGFARFFSLVFDLNQGLIVGVPGLLLGLTVLVVLVVWRAPRPQRLVSVLAVALSVGCFVGLALPTFIQRNWNADGVAMIRYGYWVTMPLLALFFSEWVHARSSARIAAAVCLVAGQSCAFTIAGFFGERYSYVEHGALAREVLKHAPARYNPVVEIFWERSTQSEVVAGVDSMVEWPGRGFGTKLLAHWSRIVTCDWYGQPQQFFVADSVVDAGQGFLYYNAPFSCQATPAQNRVIWRLNEASSQPLLESGWSNIETEGVWTAEPRALLRLALPPTAEPRFLRLRGHYFEGVTKTQVTLNERSLGKLDLSEAKLSLPSDLGRGGTLRLTLTHDELPAPKADSADTRRLGYFLEVAGVE